MAVNELAGNQGPCIASTDTTANKFVHAPHSPLGRCMTMMLAARTT